MAALCFVAEEAILRPWSVPLTMSTAGSGDYFWVTPRKDPQTLSQFGSGPSDLSLQPTQPGFEWKQPQVAGPQSDAGLRLRAVAAGRSAPTGAPGPAYAGSPPFSASPGLGTEPRASHTRDVNCGTEKKGWAVGDWSCGTNRTASVAIDRMLVARELTPRIARSPQAGSPSSPIHRASLSPRPLSVDDRPPITMKVASAAGVAVSAQARGQVALSSVGDPRAITSRGSPSPRERVQVRNNTTLALPTVGFPKPTSPPATVSSVVHNAAINPDQTTQWLEEDNSGRDSDLRMAGRSATMGDEQWWREKFRREARERCLLAKEDWVVTSPEHIVQRSRSSAGSQEGPGVWLDPRSEESAHQALYAVASERAERSRIGRARGTACSNPGAQVGSAQRVEVEAVVRRPRTIVSSCCPCSLSLSLARACVRRRCSLTLLLACLACCLVFFAPLLDGFAGADGDGRGEGRARPGHRRLIPYCHACGAFVPGASEWQRFARGWPGPRKSGRRQRQPNKRGWPRPRKTGRRQQQPNKRGRGYVAISRRDVAPTTWRRALVALSNRR